MEQQMIEARQLTRRFRGFEALHGVSFAVQRGELFGIVGPDGAGKTTLLRMLAAVLDPSSGSVQLAGHDTVREPERIKETIGYMPQRFGLYGDLSVAENLRFVGDLYGIQGAHYRERAETLYAFTRLGKFKERRAQHLSGGMKKKLALACALMHQPDVLLLDEPTTGVDPVARRDFWDLLSGLHADGTTTVVSTPYMDEAERCSRVALLFEGRLLACDTPQAIRAQVPGQVLALQANDIRAAEEALRALPMMLDVQTYGDQLNLIVEGELDIAEQAIREALAAQQNAVQRMESVPVRMEEAFIYLINQAKQEAAA